MGCSPVDLLCVRHRAGEAIAPPRMSLKQPMRSVAERMSDLANTLGYESSVTNTSGQIADMIASRLTRCPARSTKS